MMGNKKNLKKKRPENIYLREWKEEMEGGWRRAKVEVRAKIARVEGSGRGRGPGGNLYTHSLLLSEQCNKLSSFFEHFPIFRDLTPYFC